MATLIALISTFLILWLANTFVAKGFLSLSLMGRIALAVMLLFSGSSHFYKTDEMLQMMPDFLPNKRNLVYLTGVLEIVAAVGLLINRFAKLSSIAVIIFFIAILPANVIGSMKRVELGGMQHGPDYLYFRIPLQLLFIAWTYYFGIYMVGKPQKKIISSH